LKKKINKNILYKYVKTIAKIKLIADKSGKQVLLKTVEKFNEACNEIAETSNLLI